MLQHNWKCTLQSDLFNFLLVLCSFSSFCVCEADSFKTNSLTRLWKISESGNRLSVTNSTHNNSFQNTLNNFFPTSPSRTIRRFDEEKTIQSLFLGSTSRAFADNNENVFKPSVQFSKMKTNNKNKSNTVENTSTFIYTTDKPSFSVKNGAKSYNSVSMQIPTTYKPRITMRSLQSNQPDTKYSNGAWNNGEINSTPSTLKEKFTPNMIPINNDKNIVTEKTTKNTHILSPINKLISQNMVQKSNESLYIKNISNTGNIFHYGNIKSYPFINRSGVPNIAINAYENPVLSRTESFLKNQSNFLNHTTPLSIEDSDGLLPKDIEGARKSSIKKKYKKFMLPLLLAYKLKFFALLPLLMGGLVLLAGSTGMAGFFFALFAAVMGLKTHGSSH